MKHRADVLSLGAALLFALAVALVGPHGEPELEAARGPEYVLLTPEQAPWYVLRPSD